MTLAQALQCTHDANCIVLVAVNDVWK